MHPSSRLSVPAATAAIPTPDMPHLLVTRARANGASVQAEPMGYLTEDHDRVAPDINDTVIHRIFAAGLDLHAALRMIGDHRGASPVYHAIDELDRAIRDIRDAVVNREPRQAQRGN